MTLNSPIPAAASPEDAAARAALLRLIAATYRTPDAALYDDWASGRIGALVRALGGPPVAPPSRDGGGILAAAYVDLFVSSIRGVAIAPYVGWVRDGELLGESVAALQAFLSHHGVHYRDDWRDLPDHVAAIAESGALLAEAGRDGAANVLLTHYLAPWLQVAAAAVGARDESGFYGPITRVLCDLASEVAREDAA
jgi:hypothetical protein